MFDYWAAIYHNFTFQEINYRNIRVENPVVLVVNGRKLGRDKLAPSMLALSNKSD